MSAQSSKQNISRLGQCQVCNKEAAKYKCPGCSTAYCSLVCFKSHKTEKPCSGKREITEPVKAVESQSKVPETGLDSSKFDILLRDEKIMYFLRQDSLKIHLKTIFEILKNPTLSGEHSTEMRREVALKRLKELRIGGEEQNELVEEFASRVLELLE